MIAIKKYGNRRLYDTRASTYINLEQLAAMIRAGEDVRVEDAKTGEDLTQQVLLQVLLEAQGAIDLFPPGLLHRVIRAGGDAPYARMAVKQLSAGLTLLDAQMTQLERQWSWMGKGSATAASPTPSAAAAPPAEEPASTPSAGGEMDALRDRLAALESRLKGR